MMIGAVMADYPGYTIPTEPDVIIWKEPEQDRIFQENEGHKEYVKFQLPDDEYVPLSDLPIVCEYSTFLLTPSLYTHTHTPTHHRDIFDDGVNIYVKICTTTTEREHYRNNQFSPFLSRDKFWTININWFFKLVDLKTRCSNWA